MFSSLVSLQYNCGMGQKLKPPLTASQVLTQKRNTRCRLYEDLCVKKSVLMKPQMREGGRRREGEAHPLGLSLEVRTSSDEATLEAIQ